MKILKSVDLNSTHRGIRAFVYFHEGVNNLRDSLEWLTTGAKVHLDDKPLIHKDYQYRVYIDRFPWKTKQKTRGVYMMVAAH